ncbi:hypothetical protein BH24DEI2_BH24DEI2_00110 [soil metagenome]
MFQATEVAAVLLVLTFVTLAALHAYWASGGTWGASVVLPETSEGSKVFSPRVLQTSVVAALLVIAAIVVMDAARFISLPTPAWAVNTGIWVLAASLFLRAVGEFCYVGFFKRVRGTRFARWDSRLYSPLCLVMAALTFVVAVSVG